MLYSIHQQLWKTKQWRRPGNNCWSKAGKWMLTYIFYCCIVDFWQLWALWAFSSALATLLAWLTEACIRQILRAARPLCLRPLIHWLLHDVNMYVLFVRMKKNKTEQNKRMFGNWKPYLKKWISTTMIIWFGKNIYANEKQIKKQALRPGN